MTSLANDQLGYTPQVSVKQHYCRNPPASWVLAWGNTSSTVTLEVQEPVTAYMPDVVLHARNQASDNFFTKLTPAKSLYYCNSTEVLPSPTPGSYPYGPQARACGLCGDRIFLIVSAPSQGLCTSDKKQFYRLPGLVCNAVAGTCTSAYYFEAGIVTQSTRRRLQSDTGVFQEEKELNLAGCMVL